MPSPNLAHFCVLCQLIVLTGFSFILWNYKGLFGTVTVVTISAFLSRQDIDVQMHEWYPLSGKRQETNIIVCIYIPINIYMARKIIPACKAASSLEGSSKTMGITQSTFCLVYLAVSPSKSCTAQWTPLKKTWRDDVLPSRCWFALLLRFGSLVFCFIAYRHRNLALIPVIDVCFFKSFEVSSVTNPLNRTWNHLNLSNLFVGLDDFHHSTSGIQWLMMMDES